MFKDLFRAFFHFIVEFMLWMYRSLTSQYTAWITQSTKAAYQKYKVQTLFQRNIYKEQSFIFV